VVKVVQRDRARVPDGRAQRGDRLLAGWVIGLVLVRLQSGRDRSLSPEQLFAC